MFMNDILEIHLHVLKINILWSIFHFYSLIQLLMKTKEIFPFTCVRAGPDRYQENNNPCVSDSFGLLVVKNSNLFD